MVSLVWCAGQPDPKKEAVAAMHKLPIAFVRMTKPRNKTWDEWSGSKAGAAEITKVVKQWHNR